MFYLINSLLPDDIKRLGRKFIVSKYKYGIDSPKTISILLKLEKKNRPRRVQ